MYNTTICRAIIMILVLNSLQYNALSNTYALVYNAIINY